MNLNIRQRVKKKLESFTLSALYRIDRKICNILGVRQDCHNEGSPYRERDEFGYSNLQDKLDRINAGESFEYPDIVNLNQAVVGLVGGESRIVELGSGTGKFATAVANGLRRRVVASEYDELTYRWCLENIGESEFLTFVNGPVRPAHGEFDLAVSIEVVEHVKDYPGFLKSMSELAPRTLITTPNRMRSYRDYHAGPPRYFQHVREWTAGEFYWVLRCYWSDVKLYALVSDTQPVITEVSIDTRLSPLIADCRAPLFGRRPVDVIE